MGLLAGVLARAAARGDALTEVALRLALDRHPPRDERLRPAAPTLDPAQILDLLHLRIGALRIDSGVVEMTLSAQGTPATQEQLRLFVERPRRDPAAAQRAFARLMAEFGEDAVVVARLTDGHLPETQFAWEPARGLAPPRPTPAPDPTLIRRVLAHPVRLPRRPRRDPDGWLLFGVEDGPVVSLAGPYVTAVGWWTGAETRREYAFAETARGRLAWVMCQTIEGLILQGDVT
jgi:protein ImuB